MNSFIGELYGVNSFREILDSFKRGEFESDLVETWAKGGMLNVPVFLPAISAGNPELIPVIQSINARDFADVELKESE